MELHQVSSEEILVTSRTQELAGMGPPEHAKAFVLSSLLKAAAVLVATVRDTPSSARSGLLRAVAAACSGPGGNMRRERMTLCVTAWHWVAAAAPSLKARVCCRLLAQRGAMLAVSLWMCACLYLAAVALLRL